MIALLMLACAAPEPSTDDAEPTFDYPLDDTLTFSHLQAIGTHNSYHVETPGVTVPEWAYTHLTLDEQLGRQGVRQFELDLYYDDDEGYLAYHVPILDQTTNCETFTLCLEDMKRWSDDSPAHHPLVTLIELKDPFDADDAQERLAELEAELCSVWPPSRLVTPDDVQGDAADLRSAVTGQGWPALGELRGKALFVLHAGSEWRDAYLDGESTSGLLMFPDGQGDPDASWSAIHAVNDPVNSAAQIGELVQAGHLVRTRADSDSYEPLAGDSSRLEAALASGAHFISTDYPEEREGVDYVARIPGGTPSGCNPLTAPADCTSEAIEDPTFLTK